MSLIGSIFPGLAASRAEKKLQQRKAEIRLKMLERSFEAAGTGRRSEGWTSAGTDANAENAPALARLRNRARDQRRNNPYAERAVTGIADNVVGSGIVPKPMAGNARNNKRLAELWDKWGGTVACDADGMENFYGLQHKIMETVVESGECLIRRRSRKSSDGLPVPLQLQVLEPDFLDETKDGQMSGTQNRVIQGVEYDALGRRIAYWLYEQHPGAGNAWFSMSSKRVPAEDVIHVYLPRRPGQSRGYTWLAPVLQRLRSFDEMEDAVIEQAKIAACFAAFIEKDDASNTSNKSTSEPLVERLEPGILQELRVGESVTFGTPPTFNGYQDYSWQALHAVAVGLGIPYELLTGDLKGVNFSSGRMGWLHFARRVDVWQWRMLIPQLCVRTWGWFVEAQALLPGGVLESGIVGAEWVPPRRDMVDPKAETENVKERLRNGLVTWPDALRELGITDPGAHAQQIAASNEMLDELGLILDCDPRKVAAPGSAPQSDNAEPPASPAEDSADAVDEPAVERILEALISREAPVVNVHLPKNSPVTQTIERDDSGLIRSVTTTRED